MLNPVTVLNSRLARAPRRAVATRLFIVTATLLLAGCSLKYPEANEFSDKEIVLPGSRQYQDDVSHFQITPKDASQVAMATAKTRGSAFIEPKPLFIVGGYYAFGIQCRSCIPMAGVYVSGETGAPRVVESNTVINFVLGIPIVENRPPAPGVAQ